MVISIIHDISDTILVFGKQSFRISCKFLFFDIIMLYVSAVVSNPHSAIRGSMNSRDTFLKHSVLVGEMFEGLCFAIKDVYVSVFELHPYGIARLMVI